MKLLFHILSYVDVEELIIRLSPVNKYFNNYFKQEQIWEKFLSEYFPYLLSPHRLKEEKTNFQALFIEEYKRYQTAIAARKWQITLKWVLIGLRGDVAYIRNALLADETKRLAYILAAANGHVAVLPELTEKEKGRAFIEATINGNTATLEKLMVEVSEEVRRDAFGEAAHHQNFDMMQWLLTKIGHEIIDKDVQAAFETASDYRRPEVIKWLLEHEQTKVYMTWPYRLAAFLESTEYGYVELMAWLLQEHGSEFAEFNRSEAIEKAQAEGHIEIVKVIEEYQQQQLALKRARKKAEERDSERDSDSATSLAEIPEEESEDDMEELWQRVFMFRLPTFPLMDNANNKIMLNEEKEGQENIANEPFIDEETASFVSPKNGPKS